MASNKDGCEIKYYHREKNKKIERVAFLGGASTKPNDQYFKDAVEVAKLLAKNGYKIVNGGGPGIMRASTIGAKEANSDVLAITYHPAFKHKNYEGTDPQNNFDEEIMTIDYFDRTKVMLQNSDVHIVFKGGTGTISEFGMSWASSRIHEGHHKPIILYGDFWNHIIKELQTHMLMRPGEVELVKICNTPEQVLDYIKKIE